MDKRLSDFDKVMSCLLEPLGDYAPKRRYLLLDYKDSSGKDFHHEALQYVPRGVTDRNLVRLFREDLARQGYRLNSIYEPRIAKGSIIAKALREGREADLLQLLKLLQPPSPLLARSRKHRGDRRTGVKNSGPRARGGCGPQVCRFVRFSDAPPAQRGTKFRPPFQIPNHL